jgi:AraC family ethanolamine operon transcriptional activator
MIQKSPYGVYVIYFSEEFFFDLCENYHLPDPPQLLGPTFLNASALTCSPEKLSNLRKSIHHFLEKTLILLSFRARSDVIHSYFIDNIIAQLEVNVTHNLILLLAESSQVVADKLTLKRSTVLQQAEAFIDAYAKADIRTSDICRATGVSQRTLEYSFRDLYGLSPKAYLKQWRLNRVRLALRAPEVSGSKVNAIAAEWGFWHSGQLAHDYHHLFGELPSETLKKSMCVISEQSSRSQ